MNDTDFHSTEIDAVNPTVESPSTVVNSTAKGEAPSNQFQIPDTIASAIFGPLVIHCCGQQQRLVESYHQFILHGHKVAAQEFALIDHADPLTEFLSNPFWHNPTLSPAQQTIGLAMAMRGMIHRLVHLSSSDDFNAMLKYILSVIGKYPRLKIDSPAETQVAHQPQTAPRAGTLLEPKSVAVTELALKPGHSQVRIVDILLRRGGDLRALNPAGVVDLAESIATIGLLEPPVLDTSGHLLAGAHRLAALQLLGEQTPSARRVAFLTRCGWLARAKTKPPKTLSDLTERLEQIGDAPLGKIYPDGTIPVMVIDITGQGGGDLALAIEAAENNVRRQYTRDEIVALAERFQAAGFQASSGRPKAGEKTVLSALEAAVGRSRRQIQRILSGPNTSKPAKTEWEKTVAALKRAAEKTIATGKDSDAKEAKAIVAAAEQVEVLLKS